MDYALIAVGSALTPKLLGTYEKELAQTIESLPVFDIGFDVGAAEGYYAIGLLFTKKVRKIVAFESSKEGRAALIEMGKKNKCSELLEVHGKCEYQMFHQRIAECNSEKLSTLIISDCEGFEKELFASEGLKNLCKAYLIIETHDEIAPRIHKRLIDLLKKTHEVVDILPVRRRAQDMPRYGGLCVLTFIMPPLARLAMSERRGKGTAWIFAKPKSCAHQNEHA